LIEKEEEHLAEKATITALEHLMTKIALVHSGGTAEDHHSIFWTKKAN